MTKVGISKTTHYFDRAYRNYELQNPERKLDHYLDQIDERIGPGPKGLLDIGCGLGSFLERAAHRHPEWSFAGTDIEKEAIAQTRRRLPHATIALGSAEQAAFPAATFDIITAWDVFEHIPDLEAAATSVSRMLRPGGLLAFVVPVYDGVTGPVIRQLDKDPTHIHLWSRQEWIDWATDRFEAVQWHGLLRYLIGHRYLHLPTVRARRHTPAILVSCRLP
jgi:ubiquinone/menaquinone biosynthesis C-methylase UbiE